MTARLPVIVVLALGALFPAGAHANLLVGRLSRQYTQRCIGEQGREWGEPSWFEVGFTRVQPAPGVELAAHVGQLVLVRGVVLPRPAGAPPRASGASSCLHEQMRSDWVPAKEGFRVLVARDPQLERVERFLARSVERHPALAATVESNGDLRFTFANATGAPLPGVRLLARYEGCYGKPNTAEREARTGPLQPGTRASATFAPLHLEDPSGGRFPPRHHILVSVLVRSDSAATLLDYDAPVSELLPAGTAPACPARRKR